MSPLGTTDFGSAPFDIIDGDRGKNYPKQDEFSDSGFCLFLSATNVTRNGFEFAQCQFITEGKDNLLRKGKLQRDDVVLTTRGTIGNCAFFNSSIPYENMRINSGMVIFRCDKEKILPAYLYHYLRSPQFHGQVNSLRSGVAQPQLPIRDMRHIKLFLPKPAIQQAISDILSAYDDLIENNRRRIQLLEQAARLLYKEWFVHLRFPGHEHVKIKNGVPEGWEKKPLADAADSVRYGYTASSQAKPIGPKFLRITDIVPEFIDWDSVPHCQISEKDIEKYRLQEGDVVVARTGATVGYAKRIGRIDFDLVFASYLVRLRFTKVLDNLIAGIFMESKEYKAFIRNNCGGAAQPNANAKVISSAKILVPPEWLQKAFRQNIETLFAQRALLQKENIGLRRARDLLLPRLMNGDIAV